MLDCRRYVKRRTCSLLRKRRHKWVPGLKRREFDVLGWTHWDWIQVGTELGTIIRMASSVPNKMPSRKKFWCSIRMTENLERLDINLPL